MADLGGWAWLGAGLLLLILEAIVPGVFLLWFGFAAAVVGAVVLMFDISLPWQLALFGAAAIASLVLAKLVFRYGETVSDDGGMNVRSAGYVGKIYVVEQPISNGRGKIRIGDSLWIAEGPDLDKGTRVRVTAVHGTVLKVEPA
ncbi:MAG: NfeD family protein [Hyphomicrobiaceae bacterium]